MDRRVRVRGELPKLQGLSFSVQVASSSSPGAPGKDPQRYNLRRKARAEPRKKAPSKVPPSLRSSPTTSNSIPVVAKELCSHPQPKPVAPSKGKRKRESPGKRFRPPESVLNDTRPSTLNTVKPSVHAKEKRKGRHVRTASQQDHPLNKIESELPLHLITTEMLQSNRFYQRYTNQEASLLPTRDGRNLIYSDNFATFDVPPSKWNDDHVLALRILPFEDLSLSQIFPAAALELDDTDQEILDQVAEASLEDVEKFSSWEADSAPDHRFRGFFECLSGDLQMGSMERESDQARFVQSFLEPILAKAIVSRASTSETLSAHFPIFCDGSGENDPTRLVGPSGWNVTPFGFLHFWPVEEPEECHSSSCNPPVAHLAFEHPFSFFNYFSWYLISKAASKVLTRASPSEDERKLLRFLPDRPFVSGHLEGNNESSPATYARDAGLMLDQVHRASKIHPTGSQEAFVIGFTWTRFRLSAGYFPKDLLSELESDRQSLSTRSLAYVLQSQEYDVATPEGRRMAVRAILALFKYFAFPNAKVVTAAV